MFTQNQLLAYAKESTPGAYWMISPRDTAKIEKDSYDALNKGDQSMHAMYGFLMRAIWGEGYGGAFEENDSQTLGIPEMSNDKIKEVVIEYV